MITKQAEDALIEKLREIGLNALDAFESSRIDLPIYMEYVLLCAMIIDNWRELRSFGQIMDKKQEGLKKCYTFGPFIDDIIHERDAEKVINYTRKLMRFENLEDLETDAIYRNTVSCRRRTTRDMRMQKIAPTPKRRG